MFWFTPVFCFLFFFSFSCHALLWKAWLHLPDNLLGGTGQLLSASPQPSPQPSWVHAGWVHPETNLYQMQNFAFVIAEFHEVLVSPGQPWSPYMAALPSSKPPSCAQTQLSKGCGQWISQRQADKGSFWDRPSWFLEMCWRGSCAL